MSTLFTILIVVAIIVALYFILVPEASAESGIALVTKYGTLLWDLLLFGILGIFVLPAMFISIAWYPKWEAILKENGGIGDNYFSGILLLLATPLIIFALIVMRLLHKPFEKGIERWFGKKPF